MMSAPSEPLRALVVEDDDVDRERITRLLRAPPLGAQCVEAPSLRDARARLCQTRFDCVLLDGQLADGRGHDLVPLIHARHDGECPVIMITGNGAARGAVAAMRLGVDDYLPKAELTAEGLLAAIATSRHRARGRREARERDRHLRRLSLYDRLTDLPNRALLLDRLGQACAARTRGGLGFAVVAAGLDGAAVADALLVEAARRLKAIAAPADGFAHLGGGLFAGLLMGIAARPRARAAGQAIRAALAQACIDGPRAIDVSVGIALCPEDGTAPRELLLRADRARLAAADRRDDAA